MHGEVIKTFAIIFFIAFDSIFLNKYDLSLSGNRVMDSALAFCTSSPGLIPAVGKSNMHLSDGFFPSRYKVVG